MLLTCLYIFQETESSKLAQHRGIAKKLWLASELDVKLENEEMQ